MITLKSCYYVSVFLAFIVSLISLRSNEFMQKDLEDDASGWLILGFLNIVPILNIIAMVVYLEQIDWNSVLKK